MRPTPSRHGDGDLALAMFVVCILVFSVGFLARNTAQRHEAEMAARTPFNAATSPLGVTVRYGRAGDVTGEVMKIVQGGPEGPAKVTLRIHTINSHVDNWSEVTFLASELWVDG